MGERLPSTLRGPTAERLEVAATVRTLRDEGLTYRAIAERLGISRSYAKDLATDPDGNKARARKDSYRGTCVGCGGPTSGCNGLAQAPERCYSCTRALAHDERKWTREAVIDAIQRFAQINGRPPLAAEWIRSDLANGYPARTSVYQHRSRSNEAPFRRWADAIESAGFPRPRVGLYVRRQRRTAGPVNYRFDGKRGRFAQVRNYIILEHDSDGRWIEHPPVQSHSEALAIEAFIETLGDLNGRATNRFVAVSSARWIVRELKAVTTFKAVSVEPDTSDVRRDLKIIEAARA